MKQIQTDPDRLCPCQSNSKSSVLYSNCCQKYIIKNTTANTAEQLMRSRYSAFVLEEEHYLLSSWHTTTKPSSIDFDPNTKWLGLKILSTKMGQGTDKEGWVKFIARYKIAGKAHRLEEHSYFTRELGHWRYISAEKKMRLN